MPTDTDRGSQFQAEYLAWCKGHRIKPRFGAIGKHGSIAVVERLIRTLKAEGLRRFLLPLRAPEMLQELERVVRWYNDFRPHGRFHGATPSERFHGVTPATELPGFETRKGYPSKRKLLAARGTQLELCVRFLDGRGHLPIVSVKTAA